MKKRTVKFNLLTLSIGLFAILSFGFYACDTNDMNNSGNIVSQEETETSANANSRTVNSKVYEKPDVMPEPEEGLGSFLAFIGENIKYPEKAKNENIEGKVYVAFVVSKDGKISKVSVEKGLGYGMDEEAVRVVSSYDKKWKPGYIDGKAVNTKMVLPVSYALNLNK